MKTVQAVLDRTFRSVKGLTSSFAVRRALSRVRFRHALVPFNMMRRMRRLAELSKARALPGSPTDCIPLSNLVGWNILHLRSNLLGGH